MQVLLSLLVIFIFIPRIEFFLVLLLALVVEIKPEFFQTYSYY